LGLIGACVLLDAPNSQAAGLPGLLDEVTVTARRATDLQGDAVSSSEGTVTAEQLEFRPTLRTAEILESVPGLVVTQHSGDGKANQYFLRGFNLDHGTDFATSVDGMPVNMPTNAHGQGYSDLNFVIPELVDRIEYRKGTYYAEEGNFSAAGAAAMHYRRALDAPIALLSAGEDGFRRTLLAASPQIGGDDLLMGFEYFHNDGPWDLPEGYRKVAAVLRLTGGDTMDGFTIEGMGYDGRWRSSDQVPLRAIDSGEIDRFGAIDPSDGGSTHRYSLSGEWWRRVGSAALRASAYAVDYQLNLFSDFTYDTDLLHGDQFEQYEHRRIAGGEVDYDRPIETGALETYLRSGLQVRADFILPVGLYRTEDRARYDTVRQDDVRQQSYAAFVSLASHWTGWLRTEAGVRFDTYHFTVDSSIAANSGTASASLASPKLTVTFGPWSKTEYFLDVGRGFHSNDARGTTITVDPNDGVTPVEKVSPLVSAVGAEVGIRTAIVPHLQLAASVWTLHLDSELVFSGDGGTTEPSRASRRTGVEVSAYWTPVDFMVLDADLAWTHARYTDFDAVGDRIPNALEQVASVGMTFKHRSGFFGGARLRYFGAAPLIENNNVRAPPSLMVNLEGGYHFTAHVSGSVSVFNLLNRRDYDIAYYYASQLKGESAPVNDYHIHPAEPRTVRATVKVDF
jgi:outer membrane receptor protein involved in Fe transport